MSNLKPAVAVCLGFGWDSTAMLIEMERRGERPDLITFADTGAEKPGTYAFIPVFSAWLQDHGFPRPVICRYQPLPQTHDRYVEATRSTADRLGLSIPEPQLVRLAGLFGNMVANETLPGIAFGPKSCSIKWKIEAQEPV